MKITMTLLGEGDQCSQDYINAKHLADNALEDYLRIYADEGRGTFMKGVPYRYHMGRKRYMIWGDRQHVRVRQLEWTE